MINYYSKDKKYDPSYSGIIQKSELFEGWYQILNGQALATKKTMVLTFPKKNLNPIFFVAKMKPRLVRYLGIHCTWAQHKV